MNSSSKFRQVIWRLGWASTLLAVGLMTVGPSLAFGFEDDQGKGGGGQGKGGGGGRQAAGAQGAGGNVRAGGGGQIRATAPPSGGNNRAGGGATARTPSNPPAVRAPAAPVAPSAPSAGPATRSDESIRSAQRLPADRGTTVPADPSGQIRGTAGATATGRVGGAPLGTAATAQSSTRTSASWHTRTPQQLQTVNSNLSGAVKTSATANVGMHNWLQSNPQSAAYWAGWSNGIRSNFYYGGAPFFGGSPFFNPGFWGGRNLIGLGFGGFGYGGWWGYSPWLGIRPWSYWWGVPTWAGLTGWFPGYGWTTPYFYDYGPYGNIVYQGNRVLVDGQLVGTPADYAESAAELAAVDPSRVSSDPADWMALGTFSMATSKAELNPARVIQLAVNKDGVISGTAFNRESKNTYTVQGRVDKATQRVAFTIGDRTDVVMETGMYNLTQQETPLFVHFGPSKTATYLLARLPEPKGQEAASAARAPAEEIVR